MLMLNYCYYYYHSYATTTRAGSRPSEPLQKCS